MVKTASVDFFLLVVRGGTEVEESGLPFKAHRLLMTAGAYSVLSTAFDFGKQ